MYYIRGRGATHGPGASMVSCSLEAVPQVHCRANMAQIRQSRPDSGRGFSVQVRIPIQVILSFASTVGHTQEPGTCRGSNSTPSPFEGQFNPPPTTQWRGLSLVFKDGEFFVDNLMVRIHYIIVMMRWTGLAPWEFEFPFLGSLTSDFPGSILSLLCCTKSGGFWRHFPPKLITAMARYVLELWERSSSLRADPGTASRVLAVSGSSLTLRRSPFHGTTPGPHMVHTPQLHIPFPSNDDGVEFDFQEVLGRSLGPTIGRISLLATQGTRG